MDFYVEHQGFVLGRLVLFERLYVWSQRYLPTKTRIVLTFFVHTALEMYHLLMSADLKNIITTKTTLTVSMIVRSPYQNQRKTKIFSESALGAKTHQPLYEFLPPAPPDVWKSHRLTRGNTIDSTVELD